MTMRKMFLALLFAATFTGGAQAQGTEPEPGTTDPRMRTVFYRPDDVVWLRGHLGYQMLVEFDPDERIENVSVGDSTAWQVTPNRRATLLFLKPVERGAATNMTVVTNLRRYAFQLTATEATNAADPNIIFDVRFLYPQKEQVIEVPPPPAAAPAAPTVDQLNFAYDTTGSKTIAPVRVFDDGIATYFQFPEPMETPAIFAVDASGAESLINFQVRGRYFVVDAIGPTFSLRLGKEKTTVRNRAFVSSAGAPANIVPFGRAAEAKP